MAVLSAGHLVSRVSASLSIAHTTMTVVYVQQTGEQVRSALVSCMESEKWRPDQHEL